MYLLETLQLWVYMQLWFYSLFDPTLCASAVCCVSTAADVLDFH